LPAYADLDAGVLPRATGRRISRKVADPPPSARTFIHVDKAAAIARQMRWIVCASQRRAVALRRHSPLDGLFDIKGR
jgi:hypothetical protein